VAAGNLPSLILWGPAGSGKTSLANVLAKEVGAEVTRLSAVASGVADARKAMEAARGGLSARSCSWTRSTGGAKHSRMCSFRRWRRARSR
ncbi:MAG: AAA family ATPase, partial [Actinomycetota bacterium]|nr:AAA family ATPase [Actinomycetota bacterium]